MSWVTPTANPYVTSPFNPARRHPVTGVVQPHTGTDFRAPTGTPLRAVTAGTVVRSTYDPATAGNYVRIDVGGGVWVGYSHLSRRDVAVGQRVGVGQVVGLAGSTGSATAAHLHFEVCVNGVKVDPVPYLNARVVGLVDNPLPGGGGGVPSVPSVPTPTPIEETPDMDLNNPADVAALKNLFATTMAENLGNMSGGPAGWFVASVQGIVAQTLRENIGDVAANVPTSWWSAGMRTILDREVQDAGVTLDTAALAQALKTPLAEALAPLLAQLPDVDIERIAEGVADQLSTRLAQ